jgi:hypothetical protein
MKKLDLAYYVPRKCVYWLGCILQRCVRLDYKNDVILFNELSIWTERNKSKWRGGWVGCFECGHQWRAVHLLKSTHLECPSCHKMVQYSEIEVS